MNTEKYTGFTAGSNDDGKRIDRIIRQFIKEQNLSGIYKAFRKGLIRLNENKAKPEQKVSENDTIWVYNSLLENHSGLEEETTGNNELLRRQIIFEDENLIALNKKKGQLVHGEKGSLEEIVRHYLKDRIPQSLSFRPGPLHRLDRNTSGLIFFSKSIKGAREFSKELHDKNLVKFYLALLDGKLSKKEIWVDNLQRENSKKVTTIEDKGKPALSTAYPVHHYKGYTLAVIKIETGRTHQIRAQASFHGHPLSGDNKYGGHFLKGGYFLHSLTFLHKKDNFELFDSKIKASIDKEELKRLNRLLSNCTIKELKEKISLQLED